MRNVCLATVVAVSALIPFTASAQGQCPSLSITNYQFVSEQRIALTLSNVTYKADVVNPGGQQASVTATLASSNPFSFRIVPDQNVLNFPTPVPGNSQVTSTNTFTITVDRTVPFDWKFAQWTFACVPAAPVANAGSDQTVAPGTTVTLDGSKSTNPSGAGTLSYFWEFTQWPSGAPPQLSNQTAVMPTFVAAAPNAVYTLRLTVSNGVPGVPSSSATVKISTSAPSAPVACAGLDKTVPIGTTAMLDGSCSTSSNGKLTFAWILKSKPAGSNATLTGADTMTPSFVADKYAPCTNANDCYVVELTVKDSGGVSSAPSQAKVSTSCVAPVANAGTAQSLNFGLPVQLDGSLSTDACGLSLTYQWNLITLPNGSTATLDNPNAVKPTFTPDFLGTYVAQLTVKNSQGLISTPVTVAITSVPLPPTANAGPSQTVKTGDTVKLTCVGTDPNNPKQLPLTYSWVLTATPQGSNATLSSTTIAEPTFVADLAGNYSAQCTVKNSAGLSSAASTVMVSTTCATPVADAGSAQNALLGDTVNLNGTKSTGACGTAPLTYKWSFSNQPQGSNATLNGANTATPSFVPDVAGPYVVQLIVNNTVTDSTPVTVTVTAASRGAISVPASLTLGGVGQQFCQTFTVSLPANAPAGGTTVTLTSSDPSVTLSSPTVTIAAGNKTPATQPQVCGATAGGTSTINATAPFYTAGSGTVTVQAAALTLSFQPTTLTINGFTTQNLTLQLSGPAPAGFSVNLGSSNNNVATVPASVPFTTGANSAQVPVTGVAGGTVTITASATGITPATASVTVNAPTFNLTPGTLNLTAGSSDNLTVGVSPALASPLTVNVSSNNTGAATVPATVTIPAGGTITIPVTAVAAGNATVTVSGGGLAPATANIVVTSANSISLTNGLLIPPGNQAALTVSVANAPQGNLSITLTSSDPSKVSFNPDNDTTNITIPAGQKSVFVMLNGKAVGSSTITASAFGLGSASTVVTVGTQSVILPASTSVQLGNSTAISVTVSKAPPADLTVTLASNNGNVTLSPTTVTVPAGQTTASSQVQVYGAAVGSSNITASANNYSSGAGTVTVTPPTMSFAPTTLSVTTGAPGVLVLSLANGKAPLPNGLQINLSSSSGAVSVPANVTIAANQTQVNVPVTGLIQGGSAIITAAANGIQSTTASVAVITQTVIAPANTTVQLGDSTAFNVSVLPAPSADLVLTLTSSDPSVGLSTTTVTIPAGQTTPVAQPSVIGAGIGSATINVTAAAGSGYAPASGQVTVPAPTLAFAGPVNAIGGVQTADLTLNLTGGKAAATGLAVTITTDNPAVSGGTANFAAGATTTQVKLTTSGVSAPTTVNITAKATGIADAKTTVLVNPIGGIQVSNVTVGTNQTAGVTITLPGAAPSANVQVTLASGNSSIATVSQTITVPAGQNTGTGTVTGVSGGTTNITANANGYTQGTGSVTVTPLVLSATDLSLLAGSPGTLNLKLTGGQAPSTGLTVNLSSDNPSVATVAQTATFAPNSTTTTVAVTAGTVGTANISMSSSNPVLNGTAKVTVQSAPPITLAPTTVNLGQTANMTVTLPGPAASDVTVSFGSSNPGNVPVPGNITISAGNTTGSVQLTGNAIGTSTLTASANGYSSGNALVTVPAPTLSFAGGATVAGGSPAALTLNLAGGQAPAAGLSVTITTDDPTVSGGTANFAAGATTANVSLTTSPVSATKTVNITATIAGITPAKTTVTVNPIGAIQVSNVTVGTNQTANVTITLPGAAPNANVQVTLASGNTSIATVPQTITIPAGQNTGTATVTGVSGGSTTITSNATGYTQASGNVTVTPLVLSATDLSLNSGAQGTLNLKLTGGQAPAGGLTVNLASDNPNVATVSQTATFAAGGTTATATVTAGTVTSPPPQTANISMSSFNPVLNATAKVTVSPNPTITLTPPATLGLGQTANMNVTLETAPSADLNVSFGTNNPSIVPAPAPITISAGQKTGTVALNGNGIGTANLVAHATGYQDGTAAVTVNPPTITFEPNTLTVNPGENGKLTLKLAGGQGPQPNGITFNLSNGNPAAVTVLATVTIPAGQTSADVTVTGVATGVAQISASASGIVNPATATVTVPGTITLSDTNVVLGNTAQMTITLSVPAPLGGGLKVDFASSDPAKVPAPASITMTPNSTTTIVSVQGNGIGSANITATATGYLPGTGKVTVPAPAITFSQPNLQVFAGDTTALTLSLTGGAKAPAGGLVFTLTSGDTSKVTVPQTVTFNAGDISAPVQVTGVAATANPVTITASAPGISPATSAVTVIQRSISVGNASIGLGLNGQLTVTLSNPSSSPVTVSFSSNNPGVVPAPGNIIIPANTTTGSATVTGTGLGSATITVSANGFTSGTGTVNVTAGLNLLPSSLSVVINSTGTLTVGLVNALAPANGLNVTLASNNPGIASVPGLVTIPAGQNSTPVTVTAGGAAGQVTITASITGTNITAQSTVTVSSVAPCPGCPAIITPSTVAVGQSLQAQVRFTLGADVGAGGQNIQVTSLDPSKALVSASPTNAGSQQVTVNVPRPLSGQPVGVFYVYGVDKSGSVDIQLSASGFAPGTTTVTLTPSGFVLKGPNDSSQFSTYVGVAPSTLTAYSVRLDASNNFAEYQAVRGGSNIPVTFSNSNSNTGTVATMSFPGGATSGTTTFTPTTNNNNAGNTTVTALPPTGFSTPTSGNAVNIIVSPAAVACDSVTVGKNMETQMTCRLLGDTPTAPVDILLQTNNSGAVQFSKTATGAGAGSITVSTVCTQFGCSTSTQPFYVYGLTDSGQVTVTATASGYGNGTSTVTLVPSGFVIAAPGGIGQPFTSLGAGTTTSLTVYAAALPASGPVPGALAGGVAPVNVTLTNSNSTAGSLSPLQVTLSPGVIGVGTTFTAANPLPSTTQTSNLTVTTPAGYTAPASQYSTVVATVPGAVVPLVLNCDGTMIGQNLQKQCTVRAGIQSSPLTVTLTSGNTGMLLLSSTQSAAGSGQIQVTIPAGSDRATYYAQALVGSSQTTQTASATGFTTATATISFGPSGIVIEGQGYGPFQNVSNITVNSTSPVNVHPALLVPGTNRFAEFQQLRGGFGNLSVSQASDSSIIALAPSTFVILQGNDTGTSTMTGLKAGQTTITITQPAGFTAPTAQAPFGSAYTFITVNVQ